MWKLLACKPLNTKGDIIGPIACVNVAHSYMSCIDVSWSVCVSLCLSVCLSICLPVCLSACVSVSHDSELCKNGWTNLHVVWDVDSDWTKKPHIRMDFRSFPKRGTFERWLGPITGIVRHRILVCWAWLCCKNSWTDKGAKEPCKGTSIRRHLATWQLRLNERTWRRCVLMPKYFDHFLLLRSCLHLMLCFHFSGVWCLMPKDKCHATVLKPRMTFKRSNIMQI